MQFDNATALELSRSQIAVLERMIVALQASNDHNARVIATQQEAFEELDEEIADLITITDEQSARIKQLLQQNADQAKVIAAYEEQLSQLREPKVVLAAVSTPERPIYKPLADTRAAETSEGPFPMFLDSVRG